MVGLRGVGKTVLLDRMRDDAEAAGVQTVRIEAPENRSLPALLAPELRRALLRLSRNAQAKDLANRALRALAGFATALKVKYDDIEVGSTSSPSPGLADNGDLEHDLQDLLEAVGARGAGGRARPSCCSSTSSSTCQRRSSPPSSRRSTASPSARLPVVLVGAGLPQLRGRMGRAKSYAERLFDFPEVGPLSPRGGRARRREADPRRGRRDHARTRSRRSSRTTQGYAYFLQEWGKHAWDAADGVADHGRTTSTRRRATAIAALDASFFGVRFDRLTPAEKRYLRAMAALGPGAAPLRRHRARPRAQGDLARARREARSSARA